MVEIDDLTLPMMLGSCSAAASAAALILGMLSAVATPSLTGGCSCKGARSPAVVGPANTGSWRPAWSSSCCSVFASTCPVLGLGKDEATRERSSSRSSWLRRPSPKPRACLLNDVSRGKLAATETFPTVRILGLGGEMAEELKASADASAEFDAAG
jgi:hypothetical protein